MSFYYKYNFVSPEPIYALVKEELKSYFDTGAVDSTLFPIWTKKCLEALGRSSYPIAEILLLLNNYQVRLPDDFHAVREAWSCETHSASYQLPSAMYTEIKQESTRIDDPDIYCNICNECEFPDVITAIYKTTNTVAFQWSRKSLLTPGNIQTACPQDLYCANAGSSGPDSYDVRDNKFVTNFQEGKIYLQYYSTQSENGLELIPDEFTVREYVEAFLKQKVFEQLANQSTDETFNQINQKALFYRQLADEAFISADIENKKEDVHRKQRAGRRTRNRLRKYDIR